MDMPSGSKALYFLLGMEADDEGFVSPKRVMRIYGGSDDDLKVLIAKRFVIPFESGVVVITNWHDNNYLDKNRMKPTKYQKERQTLILTRDRQYELNNGLTDVKPGEWRGVEKRREKRNGNASSKEEAGEREPAGYIDRERNVFVLKQELTDKFRVVP